MGDYVTEASPTTHSDAQEVFRPTLHEYQRVAVEFLRNRGRAALLLQMGLGKTAISLSAIEARHLPVLVVAPKRVAEHVWPTERDLWRPDLSLRVASGTPAKRLEALESDTDIVVLGRDNLRDLGKVGRKYTTVVLDEMSGFKSQTSIRWKAAKKYLSTCDYVWGLTGTPAPNGLMDLWAPIYLLDKGDRLGKNITTFRQRYFTPGRQLATGVVIEWYLRPGAERQIHNLLGDICLSMDNVGRVDLPPVTYNTVEVDLIPKVRRVYRDMKRDLVTDLELIGGEKHYAANAAVMTSKLSQIAAGFLYHNDSDLRDGSYDVLHWEKIRAVEEIIEGTGSPVLVFYKYRAELDMLKQTLGNAAHTIDEEDIVRQWNAGNIPVLLLHPASAGHGLNLQHGGHTIVWTTLPWSLEEKQQADARLARQGQKNPVVIHELITPKTIDIVIRAALNDKNGMQSALLEHLESPI